MKIPFVKMQALGNDFVIIDHLLPQSPPPAAVEITPELARKMCDRRFGIGADQILWLKAAPTSTGKAKPDCQMDILNADGSIAEMCGNGIRAVARYLQKSGMFPGKTEFLIKTLAGELTIKIIENQVLVEMGKPKIAPQIEKIYADQQEFQYQAINMGNPHAVIFSDHLADIRLEKWGAEIEKDAAFPNRTNVEFVQVLDDKSIQVRVWERGAGVTLACGTGACAAAVAALVQKKAKGDQRLGVPTLTVKLPGGDLLIGWGGEGSPVLMQGPAKEVFRGEYSV